MILLIYDFDGLYIHLYIYDAVDKSCIKTDFMIHAFGHITYISLE